MSVRRQVTGIDAVAVARAFAGEAAWFWLDGGGSSSYLGVAERVLLAERGREREFLAELRRFCEPGAEGREQDPGAGFSGGWVVALGYEFGVSLLGLEPLPDDAPPAFALRAETVLRVDRERAELIGPSDAALDAWLARFGAGEPEPAGARPRLGVLPEIGVLPDETGRIRPVELSEPAERPAFWRRSGYEADVEACRAAIRDGDAYVLCLTDTAIVPGAPDPLRLYLRLREAGPALRGGVLVAGDRALVSASPERFLGVRGARVSTHPIKGTRPRGGDEREDAALADELARDPKERAENLMIVDLMRNDLSRVCDPATVATEGFLRVESHPRVHQLVSTVTGRLRDGCDVFDAIEACFPGGSMTGAPKCRAVEILASLERAPRGLYSGCFGWIDAGGDAELAMTIRSVELRGLGGDRRAAEARVGAGGGVTADSDPAREEAEKALKAAPLLAALGARDP